LIFGLGLEEGVEGVLDDADSLVTTEALGVLNAPVDARWSCS
jgi:hypothetical protein